MRRTTFDEVRAGMWTLRSIVRCRQQIGSRDLREITLPRSGRIPLAGGRAVAALLRRRNDQCLSNALIQQAWRADHGDLVDVFIGVSAPDSGFTAHAWLADAPADASGEHQPIHRLTPRCQRNQAV